ncbi:sugar phosphate isomerase/epimerase family protein [Bythopirellula goksoeyrii]|uniref:Inosose dehydratase n=1 Tax=Bythopirellula goksoeyrii TaxID=1400387 RepID=A0A5B9Q6W4_9BACT|nr:sugar phosphate isomerase/epimerase family protein [Bythopirellula goksoeyrii]QEG33450.1 Inosose dehydratase [Bythopirellula goksoeyrii]
MDKWPIGVFASIDEGLGVNLDVAHELGVTTIHLHVPSLRSRTPAAIKSFQNRLQKLGLTVTVVFAGFEGESYADIPTVQETIGLVPAATRQARLVELKEIIDFTQALGVDATGLHIGFVPHDTEDAEFAALLETTCEVCDYAAEKGIHIHLETGQEPADILLEFLKAVDRPNLWVNFDPANMILYGCGEPIPALKQVGKYVRSVHCKDAHWSPRPGETWGQEMPLGKGAVDFDEYLKTLDAVGYTGPLTIEREIPQDPARQKAEIGQAVELLERLKRSKVATKQSGVAS